MKFKWAHRFGLQTLPRTIQTRDCSDSQTWSDQSRSNVQFVNDLVQEKYHQESSSKDFNEFNDTENIPFEVDSEDFSLVQAKSLKAEKTKKTEDSHDNTYEETSNSNLISLTGQSSLEPIVQTPPLIPSLKKLRRWLPRIEDDLPKAS